MIETKNESKHAKKKEKSSVFNVVLLKLQLDYFQTYQPNRNALNIKLPAIIGSNAKKYKINDFLIIVFEIGNYSLRVRT